MKIKILKIIFKVIFILSFIPYLLVLYGICGGIIGVFSGLKELIRMFEDTYEFCCVLTPTVPACLTYQMCYIFRKKRKIMFICSFIPCIFAFLVAIKESISGIPCMCATYYGLEAFDDAMYGILEIYAHFKIWQICFIFQIVLIILAIIKKMKSKTQLQNN